MAKFMSCLLPFCHQFSVDVEGNLNVIFTYLADFLADSATGGVFRGIARRTALGTSKGFVVEQSLFISSLLPNIVALVSPLSSWHLI